MLIKIYYPLHNLILATMISQEPSYFSKEQPNKEKDNSINCNYYYKQQIKDTMRKIFNYHHPIYN
jgi:hypothetical protein